jgi:hypothetical protein
MAELHQVEIRCRHCREWFPSPVVVGDDESVDTATFFEATARCPHCGKETGSDPTSVRERGERGSAGRE